MWRNLVENSERTDQPSLASAGQCTCGPNSLLRYFSKKKRNCFWRLHMGFMYTLFFSPFPSSLTTHTYIYCFYPTYTLFFFTCNFQSHTITKEKHIKKKWSKHSFIHENESSLAPLSCCPPCFFPPLHQHTPRSIAFSFIKEEGGGDAVTGKNTCCTSGINFFF